MGILMYLLSKFMAFQNYKLRTLAGHHYLVFSIFSSRYNHVVNHTPVGGKNEPVVSLPLQGLGAWLEWLNDQGLPTAVEDVIHVGRPACRVDGHTYIHTPCSRSIDTYVCTYM